MLGLMPDNYKRDFITKPHIKQVKENNIGPTKNKCALDFKGTNTNPQEITHLIWISF